MTASAARTALAEAKAKAQEMMALINSRTAVEKAAQETCRVYSVASKANADTATNALNTFLNTTGSTPAPAPSPSTKPSTKVASEFENIVLTEPTAIKFGANGQFYQKTLLPGTHPCDYTYFGDPLPGDQTKACYLVGTDAPSPSQSPDRRGTAEDITYVPPTTTPTTTTVPWDIITMSGDSITEGGGNNPNPWPKQLQALLGTSVLVKNYGYSSTTLVQMKDNWGRSDYPGPNFVAGKRCLNILGPAGTNDLTQYNADLATLKDLTLQYFNKAKASNSGYQKAYDSTLIPRKVEGNYTAAHENTRQLFNAWKRANYQTYCDGLIDFDNVMTVNDTYDGIHPGDDPGSKKMAAAAFAYVKVTTNTNAPAPAPAPAPSVQVYQPEVVVFEGSDILRVSGLDATGIPKKWQAISGNGNAQLFNIAREQSQMRDLDDEYAMNDTENNAIGPRTVYVPGKKNALVLMIGGPDIANDNATLDSFSYHLSSIGAKSRADGYMLWVMGIPKRSGANWNDSKEAKRVQFNDYLKGGAQGYIDGYIDVDSVLNNTTNFSDGYLPTEAGNAAIAACIDAAFKSKTTSVSAPAPAPAPAPADGNLSITNSDGSINDDKWAAMAAKMWTLDGVNYRHGSPSPTNQTNLKTWFQPTDKPWPAGTNHSGEWQLGSYAEYGGTFIGGDFASNSLIGSYVADNPTARIGVIQLQGTSTSHGTFSQKPELPWIYYGKGLDAVETVYWKEQKGKTVEKVLCSANAMGRPGWAVQIVNVFQNGFIATAGFNTMINKSSAQLPAGFVATDICITSANEFALITAWDVPNKRGVLCVVALCGLGHNATIENPLYNNGNPADGWWYEWNEAHPGLHSLGNFAFMKYVGCIELVGMKAPTAVSATTGHSRYGYLDGSPGEPLCGNQRFNNEGGEARRQEWLPGRSLDRAYAKQGEAMIISRTEKKVMFVDLKPLFQYYISMYFSADRNKYLQTNNIGNNAGQWPYMFSEAPAQAPTITKLVTYTVAPTSVFVYPYAQKEEWRQSLVGFEDGTVRVYNMGGLSDTGNAAKKVEAGSFNVGANPTSITWIKEKAVGVQSNIVANHTRQFVFAVRGERAIKWYDLNAAGTGAALRRTFQDPRIIDPVCVMDTDNHGGEHYVVSVADCMGKKIHNIRFGDVILHTYAGQRFKMGQNGTDEFEYCGSYTVPGYPFKVNSANVS